MMYGVKLDIITHWRSSQLVKSGRSIMSEVSRKKNICETAAAARGITITLSDV
jgi:hypothetical protein